MTTNKEAGLFDFLNMPGMPLGPSKKHLPWSGKGNIPRTGNFPSGMTARGTNTGVQGPNPGRGGQKTWGVGNSPGQALNNQTYGQPHDGSVTGSTFNKKSSGRRTMQISTQEAVTKMASYINYLASRSQQGNGDLHIKEARYNRLVKLSQALVAKRDIVQAIKVAYPEMNESQRFKTAMQLVRGLAGKMRKAAAYRQKQAMMGAAGGVHRAAGGGAGVGPGTGSLSTATGTNGGMPMGGAGIQTAPSYTAAGAPTRVAAKA